MRVPVGCLTDVKIMMSFIKLQVWRPTSALSSWMSMALQVLCLFVPVLPGPPVVCFFLPVGFHWLAFPFMHRCRPKSSRHYMRSLCFAKKALEQMETFCLDLPTAVFKATSCESGSVILNQESLYTITLPAGACSCNVCLICFDLLASCLAWLFSSSHKASRILSALTRTKFIQTVYLQNDGRHLQKFGHCQCCWPHDDACDSAGEFNCCGGYIPKIQKCFSGCCDSLHLACAAWILLFVANLWPIFLVFETSS